MILHPLLFLAFANAHAQIIPCGDLAPATRAAEGAGHSTGWTRFAWWGEACRWWCCTCAAGPSGSGCSSTTPRGRWSGAEAWKSSWQIFSSIFPAPSKQLEKSEFKMPKAAAESILTKLFAQLTKTFTTILKLTVLVILNTAGNTYNWLPYEWLYFKQ